MHPGKLFRLLIAPLLVFLFAFIAPLAAQPANIDATLQKILSQSSVPGLAAVVLRGDQIIAQGVAGIRTKGAPERLTLNDEFLLCSATKAMTGTLAAMLVEDGKLSWTTSLGDIFSAETSRLHPAWRAVTLTQLLEHRAGAPTDGKCLWTILRVHFSKGSPAEKRANIVAKILSRKPRSAPGTRYAYSNTSYMIAAAMLEKIAGQSWETLIQERLWRPLGITTGGFGPPDDSGLRRQPSGHWGMLRTGHPVAPGGFWGRFNPPLFFGPGATARMTVTDWSKFIFLHLRGDPANPQADPILLKPESFTTLHHVSHGRFYQSGWIVLARAWAKGPREGDTGRVITSQGDNGFWHCEAWLAPEIDFAVLIVCNQGGAAEKKPVAIACRSALDELVRAFRPD